MGISYKVLDDYIRNGVITDDAMLKRIDERIQANLFKHSPIPFWHARQANYVAHKYCL